MLVFFVVRQIWVLLMQDIQMLKFGQIVDLDLIERSAPNKYVQVQKSEGWVFGVEMKV